MKVSKIYFKSRLRYRAKKIQENNLDEYPPVLEFLDEICEEWARSKAFYEEFAHLSFCFHFPTFSEKISKRKTFVRN